MKFTVYLKDPDCLHHAIKDSVRQEVKDLPGLTTEEKLDLIDSRIDQAHEAARKWFRYGEYVSLEIDTDAGTCTVLEARS